MEKGTMTARDWIEYGKMLNNINQYGWAVETDSDDYGEGIEHRVILYSDESEHPSDYHATPYAAMKEVYFKYFLNLSEGVEIELVFSDEDKEKLFRRADLAGITVDEVVIELLEKRIPKVKPAECCFNCFYLDLNNVTQCLKHFIEIQYQNTCSEYAPGVEKK